MVSQQAVSQEASPQTLVITTPQDAYATKHDWDTHRATVTKLYQEDNKTLKNVMITMADKYSFFATVKMYKVQINKWGLDKKLKEAEVMELVRMKRQRDAIHKKSRFTIRGRIIHWEQVEKYLSRRPDLQAKISTGRLPSSSGNVDIVCRSPSPEPVDVLPVPPVFTGAVEVRLPEEIGRLMKGLVDGSLDPGRGIKHSGDIELWNDQMLIALRHIRGRSAVDAIRLINMLLGQLKALIRRKDISLIFSLVDVAEAFRREWPEVTELVSGYIKQLLQILMEPRHPVLLIWNRYMELPQLMVFYSFASAAQCGLDHVESRVGPGHFESYRFLAIFLTVLGVEASRDDTEAHSIATEWILNTLASVKISDYPQILQLIASAIKYAAQLRTNDNHAAEKMLGWMQSTFPPENSHTDDRIQFYGFLSIVLVRSGRLAEAETSQLKMYKVSQSTSYGITEWTISAIQSMCRYYEFTKRAEEATRWRTKYNWACREVLRSLEVEPALE